MTKTHDRHDLLVFIGRFQPFHLGHLAVVAQALARANRVLVLVGSSNRPRSIRDPFTFLERRQMIRGALPDAPPGKLCVEPLDDALYNDAHWIANVQRQVRATAEAEFPGRDFLDLKVGLIGHSKDHTSYYLRLFPRWGSVDVLNNPQCSATEIRARYFSAVITSSLEAPLLEVVAAAKDAAARSPWPGWGAAQAAPPRAKGRLPPEWVHPMLPEPVRQQLLRFARTPAYVELLGEARYVERYRAEFAGMKYPPSFNTVDAVVVQSGHLLLVRRGGMPGRGQLALPGGFIDPAETALEACIRELREETRIKVPEPVLQGSVTGRDFFDAPHRSVRGRTFTMAFRLDLKPERELPKVKGGDDADEAFWLPLGELDPRAMFEDHYFIVQKLLGI